MRNSGLCVQEEEESTMKNAIYTDEMLALTLQQEVCKNNC